MNFATISRALLAEKPEVIVSGQKRIQSLDMIKLLSFIGVLCLHCSYVYYFSTGVDSLWSVTRFVYCMGVLAIPLFFMASGYQLLGRNNVSLGYSIGKIARLVRAAFFLYLVALAAEWLLLGMEVDITGIPWQFCLNLFQKGDYGLLWFVGGLSLVYMAYPLVNRWYCGNKGLFLWLSVLLLAVMTAVFFVSVVRPMAGVTREMGISQTLRLWNWLGYFCLGGLFKRYKVLGALGRLPVVVTMACVCFVFLNLVMSRRGIWVCEYCYASVPVILFVISVFACIIKLKIDNRLMAELAVVFMPAYIFGPVFQLLVTDWMLLLPEAVGTLVFVAVNAVLALTAGWLLMKIPGARKLLRL